MKKLSVNVKVIKPFNDSTNNEKYDINDKIKDMEYGKYEKLKSLGYVEKIKETSKEEKE